MAKFRLKANLLGIVWDDNMCRSKLLRQEVGEILGQALTKNIRRPALIWKI